MYPTTAAHIHLYSAARKYLNLRHRRDALIATPAHSGRQSRNRTYGVSDVSDLQSDAFASYAYLPIWLVDMIGFEPIFRNTPIVLHTHIKRDW